MRFGSPNFNISNIQQLRNNYKKWTFFIFGNIILMFAIVDSLLKVGGLMVMEFLKKQYFFLFSSQA